MIGPKSKAESLARDRVNRDPSRAKARPAVWAGMKSHGELVYDALMQPYRPISANVLESIGGTPLVQLRKVVPPGSARVVVKLEGANPTGNMKDRMAKTAIEAAERDGRLQPGGTVVEYTGGSTGASIALICAAKGYRAKIVTSDAFSEEKTRTARAFGAEIILIPSDG